MIKPTQSKNDSDNWSSSSQQSISDSFYSHSSFSDGGKSDEDEDGNNKVYQYKVQATNRSTIFQCNLYDIKFETPNIEIQNPGYFLRLESYVDKNQQV